MQVKFRRSDVNIYGSFQGVTKIQLEYYVRLEI